MRIVIDNKDGKMFHLLTLTTAGMTEVSVEPSLTMVTVCSGTKVVVIPSSASEVVDLVHASIKQKHQREVLL